MEANSNLVSWESLSGGRGMPCNPLTRETSRHSCCFTPYGPPPDRPDLAIYSQNEQFALGNAPSWDSPDILTNFFNPFRLLPESEITVRNLSSTATAVNAQVLFYLATFGIGQPRSLLSSQIISLATTEVRQLTFPFPQNILNAPEQRIATHIRIIHPFDAKEINNEGSQLIADAFTSQLGRDFTVQFPILNPTTISQQLTMITLPNQLSAVVNPNVRNFGPLEQIMGSLTIHVPAGLHGTTAVPVRSDVTLVGRDGNGNLIDGLTYIIWIDN
jgi:hypothetical protein